MDILERIADTVNRGTSMTMEQVERIIVMQHKINDMQIDINRRTRSMIDEIGETMSLMTDRIVQITDTLNMLIEVQSRFYRNIEN